MYHSDSNWHIGVKEVVEKDFNLQANDYPEGNDYFLHIGNKIDGFSQKITNYGKCIDILSLEGAEYWLISKLNEKKALPKIIFCDYRFKRKSIERFLDKISSIDGLNILPFILCVEDSTIIEMNKIQQIKGVDDIYCQKTNGLNNLLSRLDFILRFKKYKYQGNIEPKRVDYQEKQINLKVKRVVDILASSLCLLLLSPLFLLIAALIKLESKGPVFYTSKRVGTFYKIFNFYKFRTMVVNADQKVKELSHLNQYSSKNDSEVFFKIKNDPRITKVGSFLRKTSLDELPQLLNVLFGQMSLVGNRPLPIYEAASLTRDEWAERFMAPAGITGLWQITKRGKDDMSVKERVALDIEYSNNFSIWKDLIIMYKTVPAMIQRENV
ncbi:sugar transferase [Flexithrix dorotheae]|uniref:sugar transferase n=1 Tax=Flexithrix dorotheae TaxID=70993 RepID=UPI00036ADD5C|nr:sugar transferase [Flexithrix dorotheae]